MDRLRGAVLLGLVAVGLLLAGCGAGQAEPAIGAPTRPEVGLAQAPAPGAVKGAASSPDQASRTDASSLPSGEERLVVRNGQVSLVVADLDASLQAVVSLALELGGFVVNSNRYGEAESAFAQVTIRVPSEVFDQAVERLRRVGQRVESESTNSQDVTEEFVDLQARLRNLQATEGQLQDLLDRAVSVEDVLKVYRELTNVRGEIERLQGRIQYLERSAAYSLITVSLRPAASPEPIVNPAWSLAETVRAAARSLVRGLQGVATAGVWVAVFAPLWLPGPLLLAWGAWRWRRARRGARGGAGGA